MTNYRAPVSDMQFLLRKVFKTEEVFSAMPGTKEVTNGLIDAILEEAGKLIEGLVAPLNQSGDRRRMVQSNRRRELWRAGDAEGIVCSY